MKKLPIIFVLIFLLHHNLIAGEYTFKDVVNHYLQNNKIVKALKEQSSAKEFLIKKAEGLKAPSLDLDLNYNFFNDEPKFKTPQGSFPASQEKFLKGQLILSYIIYDFGKRESIVNQATIDKNITDLYLQKEINDQLFNIGKIFYQIISLKKIKEVYEDELKNLLEHKKRVDGFYEEGLITKNEVLQIQLEISNTNQKILKTENEIDNLEKTLRMLIGSEDKIKPIDSITINENYVLTPLLPDDRPEVKITRMMIKIKEEQLKSVESEFYPKLYASTGINYEENKYRVDDYNYFLTFGVKINLFSGNSTKNEKLALMKEISEMIERHNFAIDIVNTEFSNALNDYGTSKSNIEVTKEGIKQAEENLKIQQGKYEEHLIPITDLIDATLLLTRANLNHILSIYDNKIAYLKVLWAKGKMVDLGGIHE
ncbi:MAG: TolC family protein [Proteobacteria bacterium]|nr:TolC family protein [Pseudomonadota bacterium]